MAAAAAAAAVPVVWQGMAGSVWCLRVCAPPPHGRRAACGAGRLNLDAPAPRARSEASRACVMVPQALGGSVGGCFWGGRFFSARPRSFLLALPYALACLPACGAARLTSVCMPRQCPPFSFFHTPISSNPDPTQDLQYQLFVCVCRRGVTHLAPPGTALLLLPPQRAGGPKAPRPPPRLVAG